jgi:hypothetical protein
MTVVDLPNNSEHYWIEVDAIVVSNSGYTYVDDFASVSTVKDATHVVEIFRVNSKYIVVTHSDIKWRRWPRNSSNVSEIREEIPVEKGTSK